MEVPKPRIISWEEIRKKAELFRSQYVKPTDLVPVPIEDIVEFDLGITPWPKKGLLQKIDVDGFLSKDLKYIFAIYKQSYPLGFIKDFQIWRETLCGLSGLLFFLFYCKINNSYQFAFNK